MKTTRTRPKWHASLASRLHISLPALLFIIVLAAVGAYLLYRSFAAELPAKTDLNGDKIVNVTDLSILLSHFNSSDQSSDLNSDGKVNVTDISILLGNFNKKTAPSPAPSPPAASGTTIQVLITFYGSYDNDPPGALDIANPVIHQKAGGTGTYADPLTFASPEGSGQYKFGQIIYVPIVQKYFIREDECAVSWTAPDGCGPVTMVDLYVGNPSSSKSVLKCEESLTPDNNTAIIIDPAANLTVDPKPLWNQSTGECGNLH